MYGTLLNYIFLVHRKKQPNPDKCNTPCTRRISEIKIVDLIKGLYNHNDLYFIDETVWISSFKSYMFVLIAEISNKLDKNHDTL